MSSEKLNNKKGWCFAMRDLQSYVINCMEKLDHIGIEYGNVIDVEINTRAKNRWGQCKRVPGGYTINVNAALLDENICPDDLGLENTILHELLHSCNGCLNHGDKWKNLAQKVYDEYGINIKRTSTSSEKGLLNYEREIKPVNHQLTCLKCGHVFKRTKASALVKHPERYRCGCGGKIRLDY